jgi:exonuclease SbcC
MNSYRNFIQKEIKNLATIFDRLKSEHDRMKTICSSSDLLIKEKLDNILITIKFLSEKLNKLRAELLKISSESGNIKGRVKDIRCRISERQTLYDNRVPILENLDIYRKLMKAFGKSGVPAIIMENITEDLRNYTNEVLRLICRESLVVDFITQTKTDKGSWNETFDIIISGDNRSSDDFRDLSGGEQVRVSIALRLALSKILMRRVGTNVKFLLLDEVDQALDRQGIQALIEVIKSLSDHFKILVITHNDLMKDKFDHIITVKKDASGSSVFQ